MPEKEQTYDAAIRVRLSVQMRDALVEECERIGVTESEYIRMALAVQLGMIRAPRKTVRARKR